VTVGQTSGEIINETESFIWLFQRYHEQPSSYKPTKTLVSRKQKEFKNELNNRKCYQDFGSHNTALSSGAMIDDLFHSSIKFRVNPQHTPSDYAALTERVRVPWVQLCLSDFTNSSPFYQQKSTDRTHHPLLSAHCVNNAHKCLIVCHGNSNNYFSAPFGRCDLLFRQHIMVMSQICRLVLTDLLSITCRAS
jgi:hypothetical protein